MKYIYPIRLVNLYRTSIIVGLVILLLLSNTSVHAYKLLDSCNGKETKWSYPTSVKLTCINFLNTWWGEDFRTACRSWSTIDKSIFNVYTNYSNNGKVSSNNKRNEVYFGPLDDESVLGTTFIRYNCKKGKIKNADIVFNTDVSWTDEQSWSHDNPDAPPYCFESVALHEIGHVAGLDHENEIIATMNSFYPHGGPFHGYNYGDYSIVLSWYVWGDDCQGCRHLYPSEYGGDSDIAVSAMKQTDYGYSGNVSNTTYADNDIPLYFEFTTTVLGGENFSTRTYAYLSVDTVLSADDFKSSAIYVGAGYYPGDTITHESVFYFGRTYPKPGYYYIIVDAEGDEDSDSFNNSATLPTPVYVNMVE